MEKLLEIVSNNVKNREKNYAFEPDGHNDYAPRQFSGVSTDVKSSFEFHHRKYNVDPNKRIYRTLISGSA